MAVMGFNPAAEMSMLRTQQTLAMQASAPAAGAAPAAAADPAAAAAQGAAAPGAAADAAIGAAAVQEPPSTSKIVLQSVMRGALSGASLTLGVKQFGPMLMKVGFIGKLMGSGLTVPPTGVIGFLSKLPIVGKVLPWLGKSGLQGFAIAALIGAGVGAVFGAVTGMKKAKAAAAEYAEAMAAQQAQQPTPGDPVNTPGAEPAPGEPAPLPASKYKSWIIAREGSVGKTGGSFGHYKTHKGDTMATLSKRFHTTEAEIRKLNPHLHGDVTPGTKLKLKRKVIKNAQAWKG